MGDDSSKTWIVITLITLFVVLLVVGYFLLYGTDRAAEESAEPPAEEAEGDLFESTENPAEDLPETNPFGAETNPFRDVKTNPFE